MLLPLRLLNCASRFVDAIQPKIIIESTVQQLIDERRSIRTENVFGEQEACVHAVTVHHTTKAIIIIIEEQQQQSQHRQSNTI